MPDTDPRTAFVAGLRELANRYEYTPDLPLPHEVTFPSPSLSTFSFHAQDADRYAAVVRALGGRRDKGTAGTNDTLAATTRTFGPGVTFRVMVPRGEVCERRVVDTVTKVVTALACVHCAAPIVMTETMVWRHAPSDGGTLYEGCDGTTSYDGVPLYDTGNVATPPDFTQVSTNTTEVVEWACKPVLDEAAG